MFLKSDIYYSFSTNIPFSNGNSLHTGANSLHTGANSLHTGANSYITGAWSLSRKLCRSVVP